MSITDRGEDEIVELRVGDAIRSTRTQCETRSRLEGVEYLAFVASDDLKDAEMAPGCRATRAQDNSERQPLPGVFSNEGAFAVEPFRQSSRNVAQSHTRRLKVPVGSAVSILEY